jgi:hypothetical protein
MAAAQQPARAATKSRTTVRFSDLSHFNGARGSLLSASLAARKWANLIKSRAIVSGLALLGLAACIRVEAYVDTDTWVQEPRQVKFDVPTPEIPEELDLYHLKAGPPPAPVAAIIRERCKTICDAVVQSDDDRRNQAVAEICAPAGVDYIRSAKPDQRAQTTTKATPAENSPCRISEDYSVDVFPRLGRLVHSPMREMPVEERYIAARAFLEGAGDLGRAPGAIGDGRVLTQRTLTDSNPGAAPNTPTSHAPLLFVSSQRLIDHYRVDGPGSRFSVVMDHDGNLEGMTHAWKKVADKEALKPARSKEQLQQEIKRQLLGFSRHQSARVLSLELIYYDGGRELLQPAFRYMAELKGIGPMLGHSERVVGYVAYAKTDEALPELSDVLAAPMAAFFRPPTDPVRDDVSFSTYVTRNDKPAWAANATAFSTALTNGLFGAHVKSAGSHAAMPEQFTTRAHDYVATTDLALVEAHGSNGRFATLGDSFGVVGIGLPETGFPAAGYGPRAGGKLRHWVLHSCDVLAEPEKTPWSSVFQGGLQSVVGYSSSMYITDGAGPVFAQQLAAAAPVAAAWFATINTLNVYQLDKTARSYCNGEEPVGRPAALIACGAEEATLFDRNIPVTPNCLRVWSMQPTLVH